MVIMHVSNVTLVIIYNFINHQLTFKFGFKIHTCADLMKT